MFWSLAHAASSGSLDLARTIVFAQSAVGVSMIAFGGLNWALDGAAAPVGAVLRLEPSMAPAGALTNLAAFVLSQLAALPDALIALWLMALGKGVLEKRPGLVAAAAIGIGMSATATWFLRTVSTRVQRRFRDRVTIALESHVAGLQAAIATIAHHECCPSTGLEPSVIRTRQSGSKAMPKTARRKISFDTVREMTRGLPSIEEGTTYGSPALRVGGKLFTCIAIHKSADPDSLVVIVGFDRRDELIAAEPDVYYTTRHYVNYPSVLVRLRRVHPDALRDLLRIAHQFVSTKARRRAAKRVRS